MTVKTINAKSDLGPQKNIRPMRDLPLVSTADTKPYTVERLPDYDIVIKDGMTFIPTSIEIEIGGNTEDK